MKKKLLITLLLFFSLSLGGISYANVLNSTNLIQNPYNCDTSAVSCYMDNLGITAIDPNTFENHKDLQELSLSNNQLTSVSTGLFSGLSNLMALDLSNNQLTGIPSGLFNGLSSLSLLYVANNQLTNVPSGLFSGLSSFQELSLSNNKLTGIPNGLFNGLSSLSLLYLDRNQLTSLPSGLFNGLSSLSLLNLEFNKIMSLSSGLFAGLSSLTDLKLNNNQLTNVEAGVFSTLSSLNTLNLYSNGIIYLPNDIANITTLLNFNGLSLYKNCINTGLLHTGTINFINTKHTSNLGNRTTQQTCNSLVNVPMSINTGIIQTSFTSKGYILDNNILSGGGVIAFNNTTGLVPVDIILKNNNNILTLPKDVVIKKKSDNSNFMEGIIPPTVITANNKPDAIFAIRVGSADTPLKLTGGLATLQILAPGKSNGDAVTVSYSEDDGSTWNFHTNTTVIITGGSPYVIFTTDHFTDYVIEANGSGGVGSGTSGTLTVNIVGGQKTCSYPGNINISETSQAAFSSGTISGNFTADFVCLDLEGTTETWSLTIQSSLLTNASNSGYTIPASNIEFKTETVINTSGSNCNLNPGNTSYVGLNSTRTILGKLNDFGAICEITAPNPNIKISVPGNQPVGTYTATLTYTII